MHTFIVVDDEPLVRLGTIKKLSYLSDQVTCIGQASDGTEALTMIGQLNPDIVITDMNMPGMDGTAFLPELTNQFPDKHIIVISGYKDFEYTKHAINAKAVDYILKPFSKEDIQKAVHKILSIIDSHKKINTQLEDSEIAKENALFDYDKQLLKNYLLGHHTDDATITSKKLKQMAETHNYILFSIHSSNPLSPSAVKDFLEDQGFGDLALFLPHLFINTMNFIVLFIPKTSSVSPKDLCNQIISQMVPLMDMTKISIHVGISGLHHKLEQLHKAFDETVEALNFRKPQDKNLFSYYDKHHIHDSQDFDWSYKEEFLFRLEEGKVDSVAQLLENLFDEIESKNLMTISEIKYFCSQLADATKGILAHYFDHVELGNQSSSIQNLLSHSFTLSEIKGKYMVFMKNIANLLADESIYQIDDVVEKIKLFTQRNYQKNLNVDFISSMFYLSRSYCSHLFKERTGENYVDYANRLRVEKAKELLKRPDIKMYQIAKNVGYSNVKYFFRIFKKMEGITPKQYQQSLH